MSFQENLKYYRERAGYKSAKEFANTLGIPPNTYVGYEVRGREPKYTTLCKIADLLQVSTDDLLGRTTNILSNNENERIRKIINDLLSQFDTNKYIKIHELKKIEGLEQNDDNSTLDFIFRDYLFASIDKSSLINKLNDINLFINEFKDKLSYYCLIKYIFIKITYNLKNTLITLKEFSDDPTNIFINDEPLTGKDLQDFINNVNKTIQLRINEQSLINDYSSQETNNILLSSISIIEFIKKIDEKIKKEYEDYFKQIDDTKEDK